MIRTTCLMIWWLLVIGDPVKTGRDVSLISETVPEAISYHWQMVLPFGHGSFQEEWKPGTFPLGITPILAFNGYLWMTGQQSSWSSSDGMSWTRHKKQDWGERIYMSYVYFNNRLWMYGGMRYKERQLMNDIWSSADGKDWQPGGQASWTPRKGAVIIVFKNKLWLFGGALAISRDFVASQFMNDIWSSKDGSHWTLEKNTAPWSPREDASMVVFNDMLYMIGGNGLGDVWRSADGKEWTQLVTEVPWKQRYDFGALVFDNKVWIYGGRDTLSNHTLAARNDIWFSADGIEWKRQAEHAPWTVRSGKNSVVYKNKIWIYSGKHTGGQHNWGGDLWTMSADRR